MTIDIEAFEDRSFDERRTNADRALDVLLANEDAALRARELATRADVDPNSIGSVLARLRDRGLVRHRQPYWAIEDPGTISEELAGYDLTVSIPGEDSDCEDDGDTGDEPGEGSEPGLTELTNVDEFLDVADSLWDWAHYR